MKTLTTIEIANSEIIKDQNVVEVLRRTNTDRVDLRFTTRKQFVRQVPAKEIAVPGCQSMHVYQIEIINDPHQVANLAEFLDKLGIKYKTFTECTDAKRLTVNILKLLDTQWMIYQMIDAAKLRITNASGVEYYLDYINGDDALWASHSLVGHDAEDGAALMDALDAMKTEYEVQ